MYRVCLDHMLTNLQVQDYKVLADDLSDHRGLLASFNVIQREVPRTLQKKREREGVYTHTYI
jgi:hypothetical protein